MTRREPSAAIAMKAQRLLDQRRVLIDRRVSSALASDHPSALIGGDTAVWRIEARPDGVSCKCPPARISIRSRARTRSPRRSPGRSGKPADE